LGVLLYLYFIFIAFNAEDHVIFHGISVDQPIATYDHSPAVNFYPVVDPASSVVLTRCEYDAMRQEVINLKRALADFRSSVSWVSHGRSPNAPQFRVPSIDVYTVRHRTTEFGVVTHGELHVLGGQQRHCILHNASHCLSAIAEFLVLF